MGECERVCVCVVLDGRKCQEGQAKVVAADWSVVVEPPGLEQAG